MMNSNAQAWTTCPTQIPDTNEDYLNQNNSLNQDSKQQTKRKKIHRACVHCQKAHLTCEDVRPCWRCVKRGKADSCVDGPRKMRKDGGGDGEIPLRISPSSTSTMTPLTSFDKQSHNRDHYSFDHSSKSYQQQMHARDSSNLSGHSQLADTATLSYKGYSFVLNLIKSRVDTTQQHLIQQHISNCFKATQDQEEMKIQDMILRRMLFEYENLIHATGTPTALWRITGDLVLLGKEFSFLTRWNAQELLSKSIFDLLDNRSLLEYWQKLSSAVREQQSGYSLMMNVSSPSGDNISCACFITIRYDISLFPFLIIGQFLPILS